MASLLFMPSLSMKRTDSNFIRTYTGRRFWPLTPRADEIEIADIAHALANICRFTGHTSAQYSVAEHSLRVSALAQHMMMTADWTITPQRPEVVTQAREIALWGLLHDASEAYLCDMPSPLKRAPGLGEIYRQYEAQLMQCVAERFNLMPHTPKFVKDADHILLNTEARDLMQVPAEKLTDWNFGSECLNERIYPMTADDAEREFLRRVHMLTMARQAEELADQQGGVA